MGLPVFTWFPLGTDLQSQVPMALKQRQARVNGSCKTACTEFFKYAAGEIRNGSAGQWLSGSL
jgi:hypothetical protein